MRVPTRSESRCGSGFSRAARVTAAKSRMMERRRFKVLRLRLKRVPDDPAPSGCQRLFGKDVGFEANLVKLDGADIFHLGNNGDVSGAVGGKRQSD